MNRPPRMLVLPGTCGYGPILSTRHNSGLLARREVTTV